jgi:hypothetical protein
MKEGPVVEQNDAVGMMPSRDPGMVHSARAEDAEWII